MCVSLRHTVYRAMCVSWRHTDIGLCVSDRGSTRDIGLCVSHGDIRAYGYVCLSDTHGT